MLVSRSFLNVQSLCALPSLHPKPIFRAGGGLRQRASVTAPHPHFVSPSPRKKTRGEGLSIGKTPGGLRAIARARFLQRPAASSPSAPRLRQLQDDKSFQPAFLHSLSA